jgi:site-specific recombinase XerD
VRRFVEYLKSVGIGPRVAAARAKTGPASLIGFRNWMTRHRGVTSRTIERYENLVGKMLPALGDDPSSYDASLIRRVLLETIRGRSRAYAKGFVTALRAFLRFLAVEGQCQARLVEAVPTIHDWKLSALPRYLEVDDVERTITSCNLETPHGVRNRAVLLLLARLGLRAGDIVTMRLDDLDWQAGTVRVRGKGRKAVCLPLPQDAGEALIEYLMHARPTADTDRVFLCANAPIRPFATSATVSTLVRVALRQAGISDPPTKGAHLLRHSAATTMLRSGASLDAIATVLRHESSDTTAYYAKVDIDLLQQVTQPWPEGTPC